MNEVSVQLRSIIQCPHCGFKVAERMSPGLSLRDYCCVACQRKLFVSSAGCCVFCSYGSIPCPQQQRQAGPSKVP